MPTDKHESQEEFRHPLVELRGAVGQFALRKSWFLLYYPKGTRPEWLDVGGRLDVYVFSDSGHLFVATEESHRPPSRATFSGEVIEVTHRRIQDLTQQHLLQGIRGYSTPAEVMRTLSNRHRLPLTEYDVVEVVRVERTSYDLRDLLKVQNRGSARQESVSGSVTGSVETGGYD